MIFTIFTVPADLLTGALAYVSSTFTELSTIIALVIGLPLAFWAVRKVISLVRAR
jgi:hypothetical protein